MLRQADRDASTSTSGLSCSCLACQKNCGRGQQAVDIFEAPRQCRRRGLTCLKPLDGLGSVPRQALCGRHAVEDHRSWGLTSPRHPPPMADARRSRCAQYVSEAAREACCCLGAEMANPRPQTLPALLTTTQALVGSASAVTRGLTGLERLAVVFRGQ